METTLQRWPRSLSSEAIWNAAYMLVPVEPPHLRFRMPSSTRRTAKDAASGTVIIRSITLRHERRLHPRPADALDARAPRQRQLRVAGVDSSRRKTECSGSTHAERRVVLPVPDVAADRGRRAAGAGAHHHPGRDRVRPRAASAVKIDLGDVVVAAPVGRPLGVGELVHVVAVALGREAMGFRVDVVRVVDEVAACRRRTRSGRSSPARCRAASPR